MGQERVKIRADQELMKMSQNKVFISFMIDSDVIKHLMSEKLF